MKGENVSGIRERGIEFYLRHKDLIHVGFLLAGLVLEMMYLMHNSSDNLLVQIDPRYRSDSSALYSLLLGGGPRW